MALSKMNDSVRDIFTPVGGTSSRSPWGRGGSFILSKGYRSNVEGGAQNGRCGRKMPAARKSGLSRFSFFITFVM